MSTTGYSGTPLVNKLGIKPAMKLLLIHEPPEYQNLLQTDIRAQRCRPGDIPDLIHLFVKNEKEFIKEMKGIKSWTAKNKSLVIWVSWYKKASGIATDITEDTIRNYALQNELVDIKVCAMSDNWSGLKLVVPKKLR